MLFTLSRFTRSLTKAFVILTLVLSSVAAQAQMQKVVTLVKGEVLTSDGKPVKDVAVAIYKGTERIFSTKSTSEGKFMATLHPNTTYRVTFTNSSYLFREQTLVIPAMEKYAETPLKIALSSLKSGEPFLITDMVFKPGSSTIENAAALRLEDIAQTAKQNPKLSLEVTVYPDATIKSAKQKEDSELLSSRSSAVRSFLMSRGLNERQFIVEQSKHVPSSGKFAVEVSEKKKKKVTKKIVMVPQYIQVVAKVG